MLVKPRMLTMPSLPSIGPLQRKTLGWILFVGSCLMPIPLVNMIPGSIAMVIFDIDGNIETQSDHDRYFATLFISSVLSLIFQ